MKYKVEFAPRAAKDLRALDKDIAGRIVSSIQSLESDLSGDIKSLKNFDYGYRLRVGDYRVLFDLERDLITIRRVKHRREAY